MSWQQNIISDLSGIRELLTETKSIAVLGIKTEAQANQPAFYVPKYLDSVGFEVVPVPVYYPEATQILGHRVYRSLVEIPFDVDLVNVLGAPSGWGSKEWVSVRSRQTRNQIAH